MSRGLAAAGLALALTVAAASSPSAAGEPPGDPQRGRSVFHRGKTADGGEIQAAMGDEGFEVAASLVPCASCHGRDGRGRPEGGVAPSDITWPALTDPRGARQPDRRQHPPYDQRSVLRAVTLGVDPAGNPLSTTMPRYRLSRRDAADLIAYLRELASEQDPGIDESSLRIATLLPSEGPRAYAVHGALEAYFDDLNRRGGVYGRRLALEVIELEADPKAETARERLRADPPFALVAPDLVNREQALADFFEQQQLPVVGPSALDPALELPPNRHVFYLYGGVEELARSLVDFLATRAAEGDRLAVLYGGQGRAWADGALDQARVGGWAATTAVPLEQVLERLEGGAEATSAAVAEAVLLLAGDAEVQRFLRAADARGWHPAVAVPGLLAARALLGAPGGFSDRLYCAFPVLLSDATPGAIEAYLRLASEHGLGEEQLAAQLAAVSAAALLVEGLNRAGRNVSRERLIEALEGLYDFSTGFTPAMTFHPNRRLGARGAHIVGIDLLGRSFRPIGERIEPR